MSDPKRGGSRDISELKQRLGLKKTTTQAATPLARPNGITGGVVPPPGIQLPPAAPPQPVIPNAADDPFGAMNAMAAQGTVQRAPEIVIVNDGKPVEHVGASRKGGTIAKIAIPAVAALVIGVAIGKAADSASIYNTGLKEVRAIVGEDTKPATSTVRNVKHALSVLDGVLDDMKAKNDFRPDPAADKKLAELTAQLDVDTAKVYRTAGAVERDVDVAILSFYGGVNELKSMLDTHQRAAKFDDAALGQGKAAGDAARVTDGENAALASIGAVRYGALIQAPTKNETGDVGVQIVELGPPYCGNDKTPSPTGKCDKGEQPNGFAYRADPGAGWKQGDLQVQGSENVPAKKLLLLLPTPIRDSLIKGSQAGASEVFYAKRLRTVAERTKKLLDEANKLEQRLEVEANKGQRFSFFL